MRLVNIKEITPNKYLATSSDPQIIFEFRKPSPYLYISGEFKLSSGSKETVIYYSLDGSFKEELKITLSSCCLEKVALYKLSTPARFFRFDPQDVEGQFELRDFQLRTLSGYSMVYNLGKRAFGEFGLVNLTEKFVRNFSLSTPRLSVRKMLNSYLTSDSYCSVKDRNIQYAQWFEQNMPSEEDLKNKKVNLETLTYQPKISLVMPVYNPPVKFFKECLESVRTQIYENWELCIGEDKSTDPEIAKILREYEKQDSRFKVVFRKENGHISKASNSALDVATGEFIGLVDHDDLLTKDALYEVVEVLNEKPDLDMIYTDEDKITDGKYINPSFKPDWNSDSFLSRMYTCHFGVYRKTLIDQIGGFRVGYEGSQDYDLVLRFTELTDKIYHIPKILYHWRIHEESTAGGGDAKPYCFIAAEKALADALVRREEPGKVFDVPGLIGNYTIRYDIKGNPKVSIIIPTRDALDYLKTCVDSIFGISSYKNFEILIVDNGSQEKETLDFFDEYQKKYDDKFKVLRHDIPFNFALLNNLAAEEATGEYLLFLNNDTKVITEDWIEGMLEQAQRKFVGAVGAKLLYSDNTVQHAGVLMGVGGIAVHAHRAFPDHDGGYLCNLATINNYSAVTGACLMCSKSDFNKVGKFEEQLQIAYNDIDLCLKFRDELGLNNVYVPHVKLYHFESKSRGYDISEEKKVRLEKESDYMREHWSSYLEHDPCYNPNLTQVLEDYTYNIK